MFAGIISTSRYPVTHSRLKPASPTHKEHDGKIDDNDNQE